MGNERKSINFEGGLSLVSVGISREILSLDEPQGALGKKPNKRRARKEESEKKMQSKSGRSVAVSIVQNWDSLRDEGGQAFIDGNCEKNFASFSRVLSVSGFAVYRFL